MAEQAYAYVTLIPVAKGFQSAVAKELAGVGGAGGKAGKAAGDNLKSSFSSGLKGLAGLATTAFAAVGVGKFFADSVKQASDLNESLNAVNVSFGANASGIQKLGEDAAKSLGLSTQQFNQMAVGFTAFAEKVAGPGGDVVKVMDDLTTRGADFASVMNLEVNDAMVLFRSGLAGETEPLRRYGIDVSEAAVKTFAYANNIAATGTELTEAQKVQARYGAIMEQTSRMQGDFANTSDQLANATRIVKAQFADLQAEIGVALLPALNQLVPAIIPIVEQAAPLLVRILEALIPVVETLSEQLEPLFSALEPLIEVFAMLAETVGQILADLLPPLIEVLAILAPVVLDVAKAFLPLIDKLLPSMVRLLDALMPFIEGLATMLTDFVIPALEGLAGLVGDVVVVVLDVLTEAFKMLGQVLGPVYDFLKPIIEGLLALMGIQPASLKKTVSVSAVKSGDKEVWDVLGSRTPTATTTLPTLTSVTGATGTGATSATANAGIEMRSKLKDLLKDTKKSLIENRKDYNKAIAEANKDYNLAQRDIAETYDKAITDSSRRRDESLANALKSYNQNVADISARTAQQLADIVQQSMNRLRDAYRSAAEVNIADMFSSDAINKNIGGLIDGLRTKLTQSRQLIANAGELASRGFSQTFIEQVVAAGAETGNELAQGILNATPEQQREIQDLFKVIETEASTGMDGLAKTLYEKNGLATQELKDMYTSVLEEQRIALAEQKVAYDEQVAQIMATFNSEMTQAQIARDEALAEAEVALNEALLKASETFLENLTDIQSDFKEKVADMKSAAKGLAKEIAALNSAVSSAQAKAQTSITGLKALTPMATGGLVTGPTPALVGEAGPELVIPLDRFESMVQNTGNDGKSLNYYAAPNQSIDSEAALFQAMRRAKVVANW